MEWEKKKKMMWITAQTASLQTATGELIRQCVQFPHPLRMYCSSHRPLFTPVIFPGICVILQYATRVLCAVKMQVQEEKKQ